MIARLKFRLINSFYDGCNYLSMLAFKFMCVSKKVPELNNKSVDDVLTQGARLSMAWAFILLSMQIRVPYLNLNLKSVYSTTKTNSSMKQGIKIIHSRMFYVGKPSQTAERTADVRATHKYYNAWTGTMPEVLIYAMKCWFFWDHDMNIGICRSKIKKKNDIPIMKENKYKTKQNIKRNSFVKCYFIITWWYDNGK